MKTLRTIIILALFSVITLLTNAQPKFYLGLKAGLGLPNLSAGSKSTPLSEGYSSRLGFYGGLVTEYQSEGKFGLRGEINYSCQGGQRDGMQALPLPADLQQLWQLISQDPYMYADIKSDAILNYIEIPVMGKLTFSIGPRINFYLQAGPYVGIRLNAKNITSGSSGIYLDKAGNNPIDAILQLAELPPIGAVPFDNTQNITSDIHRFNIGAQGGIGIGMMVGSGKFFIEAGGNYGFVPVQIDSANGTNNTGAGTVTIGYMFEL
jgi:hypothetical protein